MNPVMFETMEGVGDGVPVAVSELIGTSINVFHKHPEHLRKVLSDPKNLPWSGHEDMCISSRAIGNGFFKVASFPEYVVRNIFIFEHIHKCSQGAV
jgi:hypothetical protein